MFRCLLRRLSFSSTIAALLVASASSFAYSAAFDEDYDEKPWSEIEVSLPPFPDEARLVSFRVGSVSDVRFQLDPSSVSVGLDGVIRYVLVIVSPSGAVNVSFEGMRCTTAERRFYAFGRPEGSWSKAKTNHWVRIRGGTNNHHVELYSSYFCDGAAIRIENKDELIRLLRAGGAERNRK